jgi:ankyrin repeat protein
MCSLKKLLSEKGPKYPKNEFSEDQPSSTKTADLQCRSIDIMFRRALDQGEAYRVRFLLKFAADKQIPLAADYSPLHISVRRVAELRLYEEMTQNNVSSEIARAEEIVVALLATSADVDSVDSRGRTALHFAALADAQRIVRLLLKAGSSVKSVDNRGLTPLDMAIVTNRMEVVRLLLNAGVGLEVQAKRLKPIEVAVVAWYLQPANTKPSYEMMDLLLRESGRG